VGGSLAFEAAGRPTSHRTRRGGRAV